MFAKPEAAKDQLKLSMRIGDPPEPLPPSTRCRRSLLEVGAAGASPEFKLLTGSLDHLPATMAPGECYLAIPKPDTSFALVLPRCNTQGMALHLAEISAAVAPGAHAILLLDQAGWHGSGALIVPANITLLPLPSKCPELTQLKCLAVHARQLALQHNLQILRRHP